MLVINARPSFRYANHEEVRGMEVQLFSLLRLGYTLESPATVLESCCVTYNRLWSLTLEGFGIIAVSRLESTYTLTVDTVMHPVSSTLN
jgi:hypothetical protein